MEKKVIKKLKHYDNVLIVGRKKYAQNYIDYAGGYMSVFEDIIIFWKLGLQYNVRFVNFNCQDFRNGYLKGKADLMTWRAEREYKKQKKVSKIQNDLSRFCKVVLDDRKQLDMCLSQIEHIKNATEKQKFLEENNLLDKYKNFDFDKILLGRYKATYQEKQLKEQLAQRDAEIATLKERLRENTQTVCDNLIHYVMEQSKGAEVQQC